MSASNDNRLGAQEAPPAIMSLYTGAWDRCRVGARGQAHQVEVGKHSVRLFDKTPKQDPLEGRIDLACLCAQGLARFAITGQIEFNTGMAFPDKRHRGNQNILTRAKCQFRKTDDAPYRV